MSESIHRIVSALASVAALALCTSAGAATYVGRFDPAVYEGVASFDVPDGCILADGVRTVGDPLCPQVDFLGATVNNQPNPPITGTLTFGFEADVAFDLLWSGGVLIGLDTGHIGPAAPNGTFSNSGGYVLQFNTGSPLIASLTLDAPPAPSGPTVDLLACLDGCGFTGLVGDEPATQLPYVRVTSIPEPGSLALVVVALFAMALWQRRRTRG